VSSSCKTTYTNQIIPEAKDILNEQTAIDIKTHQSNEKTLNTNMTSNESKITDTNSFLPQNMYLSNENSAIKILNEHHTNISESHDLHVTSKRPAPESTCPSSPLSPKPCFSNMETLNIPQAHNNPSKEKKQKKPKSDLDLLPLSSSCELDRRRGRLPYSWDNAKA